MQRKQIYLDCQLLATPGMLKQLITAKNNDSYVIRDWRRLDIIENVSVTFAKWPYVRNVHNELRSITVVNVLNGCVTYVTGKCAKTKSIPM